MKFELIVHVQGQGKNLRHVLIISVLIGYDTLISADLGCHVEIIINSLERAFIIFSIEIEVAGGFDFGIRCAIAPDIPVMEKPKSFVVHDIDRDEARQIFESLIVALTIKPIELSDISDQFHPILITVLKLLLWLLLLLFFDFELFCHV